MNTTTSTLTPEGQATALCRAVLAEFPIAILRNNVGMAANATGAVYKFGLGKHTPDFAGCIIGPGRLIFIEMKKASWNPNTDRSQRWLGENTKSGKRQGGQRAFLTAWAKHGAACIVASDPDALRAVLKRLTAGERLPWMYYATAVPFTGAGALSINRQPKGTQNV
jgi:hypothetical protein